MHHRAVIFTVALAALSAACRRDSEPAGAATTRSAELGRSSEPERGAIETVDVASDRAALVVAGVGAKAKRPIVYIHGMCGEAKSDLDAWSSGVRTHGTIIALEGDAACANGGRTWSQDVAALDRRVDTAIAAVRSVRGIDLDASEVTVIGESMGATRAVSLAARSPDKYTRLVLVGAPEKSSPKSVGNPKAVAVLAGEKEDQAPSQQTVESLSAGGLNAKLWTLAGAVHGEYGPNGAATMSEALAFVSE
ncbi:MAG: alpha/beta hydrolase [Labilithrix sp.]|nr:alpha/beta hydrolase [Labilithrix sp.]MCW5810991.1 alpha/beta hydrolase [Labilithrix sp.]